MANALEQASKSQRIVDFYDSQAFAPLFLKGEALQQSLEDTWARIEPVAKQAAQK
jgi:tripartite-type tricarboxylate transporter receptor subunit TctC